MDKMPMSVVLLGSIPEAILMAWAGFLLLEVRPPLKKVILVGILQGFTSYYIRRYIDFGPHIWAHLGTFIFYSYLIIRANLFTTTLAVIIPFALVILVEGPMLIFGNVNIAYLLSTEWERLLFFIPHDILLGAIIYICLKKDISLIKEFTFLKKFVG
ncbi:MAG: hypothetical protein AB2421_12720 [Thermotaleaceae bacterium]